MNRRSAVLMLVPGLVLPGSLLVPAPAQAAGLRYASPTGTTAQDCLTPANACNIEKAIDNAASGDEVILAPGSYTTSSSLLANGVSVRGTPGEPRPVINSITTYGLFLMGDGVRVSDLSIVHSGGPGGLLVTGAGTVVERVDVRSAGVACNFGLRGLARDSLCVATGASPAIYLSSGSSGETGTAQLRNITAISASDVGIVARSSAAGSSWTIDLRNVIASGATDIVREASSGATVNVNVQNSNYQSVIQSGPGTLPAPGTGTNQAAEPVFADTTGYHQAATSPTINAGGVDAAVGTTDLDGEPRVRGKAPDIGVDEFLSDIVPPDTVIGKGPKKKTFKTKAKFTFIAGEPGATFLCTLDKKPAAPCTSPYKIKVKKGKHTFSVQAVDATGNVDPTAATYKWKVRKRRA